MSIPQNILDSLGLVSSTISTATAKFMRFFIALEIPKENLAQFKAIQDSLHTLIPQARLTALDKIHLTLAFIGEQPDKLKDQL